MKNIKYLIQFIIIIFFFLLFKIIGYKNASNLGSRFGRYFGRLVRSDKIILKNLSNIEEYSNLKIDDKDKIVNSVFSNYGRILSDYVYLNKFRDGSLKKFVNIKGYNHLEEIKLKNKKVVFVSGHFNNFELMAMFIDVAGIKLSAIYRPLNNIFLNGIMEKIRLKHICKKQIKKGKSGTRELLQLFKDGYSIALMNDQRVSEGIKSKLFNRSALTTTIPAQLVKKYSVDVVPVYIERKNDIYFKMHINKPIFFDENKSLEEITNKLNKILEEMILKNPDQWIWSHDRWK